MSKKKKKRSGLGCVALMIGVVAVFALGVYLARGAIVTHLARERLAERGLQCDEAFAVSPEALDYVEIAESRCEFDDGAIEAIEFAERARIDLNSLEPTRLSAGRIRLVVRPMTNGSTGWSRELSRYGVEADVAAMLGSLAAFSHAPLPTTAAEHLEIVYRGESVAQIQQLLLEDRESETQFHAESLRLSRAPALGLRDLSGRFDGSEAHINAMARMQTGVPLLGNISVSQRIAVHGSGLDTNQPRFRFSR